MNLTDFFSQIRWRPQIGDPSVMGWLTVAAYAAAAVLCFVAARRDQANIDPVRDRLRRRLWLGVSLLMVFLCINKQLDLQSLFTDLGRALAKQEGWYDQRRTVQRWFVLAVAASGLAVLAFLAWRVRPILKESLSLLIGLSSLLTFIVIRAASFHHVDVLLRSQLLGLRVNWILELGGIGLIALSAYQARRRARTDQIEE